MYFCGPGGYKITLSPGSEKYKLEKAPSGHWHLPCSYYRQWKFKEPMPPDADFHLLADTEQDLKEHREDHIEPLSGHNDH